MTPIQSQLQALGQHCQLIRQRVAVDQVDAFVHMAAEGDPRAYQVDKRGRTPLVIWIAEAADAEKQLDAYAAKPPQAALPAPAASATATGQARNGGRNRRRELPPPEPEQPTDAE